MAIQDMWKFRAEACVFEKEYTEAIQEFKQGMTKVPWKDRVWISIARCHDKLGAYAETLDGYDQALKIGLFDETILERAHAVSCKEGVDKADEWLDKLYKDHPNLDEIDLIRGSFHMEEGRYKRAIELFTRRLDTVLRDQKIDFDDRGMVKIEFAAGGRERWKNYYPLDPLLGKMAECHFLDGDVKSALRCATMGISAGQAKHRGGADPDPAEVEAGDASCRLVLARVSLASGRVAESKAELTVARALAWSPEHHRKLRVVEAAIKDFEAKNCGK